MMSDIEVLFGELGANYSSKEFRSVEGLADFLSSQTVYDEEPFPDELICYDIQNKLTDQIVSNLDIRDGEEEIIRLNSLVQSSGFAQSFSPSMTFFGSMEKSFNDADGRTIYDLSSFVSHGYTGNLDKTYAIWRTSTVYGISHRTEVADNSYTVLSPGPRRAPYYVKYQIFPLAAPSDVTKFITLQDTSKAHRYFTTPFFTGSGTMNNLRHGLQTYQLMNDKSQGIGETPIFWRGTSQVASFPIVRESKMVLGTDPYGNSGICLEIDTTEEYTYICLPDNTTADDSEVWRAVFLPTVTSSFELNFNLTMYGLGETVLDATSAAVSSAAVFERLNAKVNQNVLQIDENVREIEDLWEAVNGTPDSQFLDMLFGGMFGVASAIGLPFNGKIATDALLGMFKDSKHAGNSVISPAVFNNLTTREGLNSFTDLMNRINSEIVVSPITDPPAIYVMRRPLFGKRLDIQSAFERTPLLKKATKSISGVQRKLGLAIEHHAFIVKFGDCLLLCEPGMDQKLTKPFGEIVNKSWMGALIKKDSGIYSVTGSTTMSPGELDSFLQGKIAGLTEFRVARANLNFSDIVLAVTRYCERRGSYNLFLENCQHAARDLFDFCSGARYTQNWVDPVFLRRLSWIS